MEAKEEIHRNRLEYEREVRERRIELQKQEAGFSRKRRPGEEARQHREEGGALQPKAQGHIRNAWRRSSS